MATIFIRSSLLKIKDNVALTYRHLKYLPREYDKDPAPLFFHPETQSQLKSLTRTDPNKVYRMKQSGRSRLEMPVYKFLTDEQLEECVNAARKKMDHLLQIPPAVKVRESIETVIDREPALEGLDASKHVFVDISFGLKDNERLIVVREADGTLLNADWDVRDRMNQLYFPKEGRQFRTPKMFEDDHLERQLDAKSYEFVLDRACVQFEPHHPDYQRVTSIVYQHISAASDFELLRSTRHFGALAFFLLWFRDIDNLLLDIIASNRADEVYTLLQLYERINRVGLPLEDFAAAVSAYVERFSARKSALQLALDAHRDVQQVN